MANFVIKRDCDVDYWLRQIDSSPDGPTALIWTENVQDAIMFVNKVHAQAIASEFVKRNYTIVDVARRLTPNWKYTYQHIDV